MNRILDLRSTRWLTSEHRMDGAYWGNDERCGDGVAFSKGQG